ncbi:hypothetical protein ACFLXG_01195 [Chloroflexota bacterium]
MRIKERGQVLILVLIMLAIGSLVVIPVLRLAYTGNRVTTIFNDKLTALYTLDGAQEYVMWKLLHGDWASEFILPGEQGYLDINNCGTTVTAVVTMRAIPGEGGLYLALADKIIQPTKAVTPFENIQTGDTTTFTYTIALEQMSNNTTQPLEAIFDVLPARLQTYVPGSTKVRINGGEWLQADDPNTSQLGARNLIFWPDTYDIDTEEGGFSSYTANPYGFHNVGIFTPRQINELQFQMSDSFNQEGIFCNWVVLKPWNTVSGPQAPIAIGTQTSPYTCDSIDSLNMIKIADPDFITPGVPTTVRYTITITNNYGSTREIDAIIDYLPAGFEYQGNVTCTLEGSSLNVTAPQGTDEPVELNGQLRYVLLWGEDEFPDWNLSYGSGDTMVMSFDVLATKDVSGSYFNEVLVDLKDVGIDQSFTYIGLTPAQFTETYSWDQGSVTVPTYDVTTEDGGITLDSNLALVVDGISITSFNIR